MEEIEIQEKVVVKDLGLFMSNNMGFTHHIKQAVNKGKVTSGWTSDPEHLLPFWKTLVIPRCQHQIARTISKSFHTKIRQLVWF